MRILGRGMMLYFRCVVATHARTALNREQAMGSIYDIGAHILARHGEMSGVQFQKLVYYCQAWNLAWFDRPLFEPGIQAWKHGPVVRELWTRHAGAMARPEQMVRDGVTLEPLGESRAALVDCVTDFYSSIQEWCLVEITHREDPWVKTRNGLMPHETSTREIPLEVIKAYYRRANRPALLLSEEYKRGLVTLASLPVEIASNRDEDRDEDYVSSEGHSEWLRGLAPCRVASTG